jgi:hypothetical protein
VRFTFQKKDESLFKLKWKGLKMFGFFERKNSDNNSNELLNNYEQQIEKMEQIILEQEYIMEGQSKPLKSLDEYEKQMAKVTETFNTNKEIEKVYEITILGLYKHIRIVYGLINNIEDSEFDEIKSALKSDIDGLEKIDFIINANKIENEKQLKSINDKMLAFMKTLENNKS